MSTGTDALMTGLRGSRGALGPAPVPTAHPVLAGAAFFSVPVLREAHRAIPTKKRLVILEPDSPIHRHLKSSSGRFTAPRVSRRLGVLRVAFL